VKRADFEIVSRKRVSGDVDPVTRIDIVELVRELPLRGIPNRPDMFNVRTDRFPISTQPVLIESDEDIPHVRKDARPIVPKYGNLTTTLSSVSAQRDEI
jgi:hypothetical protein